MRIDRTRFLLLASALAATAVVEGKAAPPAPTASPTSAAKTRCTVLGVAPRCAYAADTCVNLADALTTKSPAQVPAFLTCIETTAKTVTTPSEACKSADAKAIAADKARGTAEQDLSDCRNNNRLACTNVPDLTAANDCKQKCIEAYTKKLGSKPTAKQIEAAAADLEKCNKPCEDKAKAVNDKAESCLKTKCTKELKASSDAEAAVTAATVSTKCASELDAACTAASNVNSTCRTKFAKFFPAGE